MQIRCSWNDPQTNIRREPILNLPVAFGRDLATMKQRITGNLPRMVISNNLISSFHCLIELENNQLVVKDQNSTNGTFINNIRQQNAILNDGDILKIGSVEITIKIMMTYSPHPPTPSPTGEGENSYIPKKVKIKFYNANNQQENRIFLPPIALGKNANIMLYEKSKLNTNIQSIHEIKDNSLNDYHALFYIENNQLVVIDQNSTHGIFVNTIKQQKAILQNGDNLRLGNVKGTIIITQNEMIIDIHNTQPAPPPPPPPPPRPQITIRFYHANRQKINNILTTPIALGSKLSDMISNIGNDITPVEINHHSLSPYHALIDVENGQLMIKDQGSANGTFVNDRQLQISLLKNNDKLKLGKVEGTIVITQNEMMIKIDNIAPPIISIQCPKCGTIYENNENISRSSMCMNNCGSSLADGPTFVGLPRIIEMKVN